MKDNFTEMGGCCCCCASNISELNRSQPFFHHLEEHEPLSSSTGLLVDTNLDTSVPDTYRPPPPPIPYETYLDFSSTSSRNEERSGHKTEEALGSTNTETVEETNEGSILEKKNLKSDENCKVLEDERSDKVKKCSKFLFPPLQDEDDSCPICLEEYDADNPKILTKCDHHFHLACIFEWMERSDTCAVCDQEMVISPALEE